MKEANVERAPTQRNGSRTLAIGVGGAELKASVLAQAGTMLVDRIRAATPYPCSPRVLIRTLAALAAPLPIFDRISVEFSGVVDKSMVRMQSRVAPQTVDVWGHVLIAVGRIHPADHRHGRVGVSRGAAVFDVAPS
jgi:hypothetical protein